MEDTGDMIFWWHTREARNKKESFVVFFPCCGTLDYFYIAALFNLSMVKKPKRAML